MFSRSELACLYATIRDRTVERHPTRDLSRETMDGSQQQFREMTLELIPTHLRSHLEAPPSDVNWQRVYSIIEFSKGESGFSSRLIPRLCIDRFEHIAVRLLLLMGCDPSVNDSDCFDYAVRWAKPETIQLLMSDTRVDVLQKRHGGHYCLRPVIEAGRVDIIALLLSDPRISSHASTLEDGLKLAVQIGDLDMIHLILRQSALTKAEINNCISSIRTIPVLELLLSDPRMADWSCDIVAVSNLMHSVTDLALIIRLLQDERVSVDGYEWNGTVLYDPFSMVASRGNRDLLLAFLDNPRVRPHKTKDNTDSYLLGLLCACGNLELVRLILSRGKVTSTGYALALIEAAKREDVSCTRMLMDNPVIKGGDYGFCIWQHVVTNQYSRKFVKFVDENVSNHPNYTYKARYWF